MLDRFGRNDHRPCAVSYSLANPPIAGAFLTSSYSTNTTAYASIRAATGGDCRATLALPMPSSHDLRAAGAHNGPRSRTHAVTKPAHSSMRERARMQVSTRPSQRTCLSPEARPWPTAGLPACIGNRCSPPSPSIDRARLVLPQETCPGPAAASTKQGQPRTAWNSGARLPLATECGSRSTLLIPVRRGDRSSRPRLTRSELWAHGLEPRLTLNVQIRTVTCFGSEGRSRPSHHCF